MRLFFILALLSLSSAGFAETKLFRYNLNDYPKGALDCHATAKEVGNKFVTTTGQGIRLARCLAEDSVGYTIQIEYEAETPTPLVSTKSSFGVYPLGQYKTRELCDAELPGLSQTFQNETGLRAAFAYCEREPLSQSYQWFARLDAFGTTTKPPRVSGFLIFGIPVNFVPGQLATEITAGLQKLGITVTHVRTHSGGGYGTESVTYYHTSRLSFDARELTKAFKKEQCLSQLGTARAELELFDVKPLTVYCGQDMLSNVELTSIYPESPDLRITPSVEVFKTFEDCIAGRAGLIQKYQVDLKLPVLGGACTATRRGFQVALFEKH